MQTVNNQTLVGERALFHQRDLIIDHCLFEEGESPLKESQNICVSNSTFSWKYPIWYSKNIKIANCKFSDTARSGIWYTDNITIVNSTIDAPKLFRRSSNITVKNCTWLQAEETLWNCRHFIGCDLTVKGDYFGMNSSDIELDNIKHDGNYIFDGGKNIIIRNSTLLSKDAFWNCENVTLINCTICGEYFGWNSKNITLQNCTVESLQGFCYMENLVMKNCILKNSTLVFEYSTVDVEIESEIDSVKNPLSGIIKAEHIGELILEKDKVDIAKTAIICRRRGTSR